jgi:hypothetical protein
MRSAGGSGQGGPPATSVIGGCSGLHVKLGGSLNDCGMWESGTLCRAAPDGGLVGVEDVTRADKRGAIQNRVVLMVIR